ncbi:hypothetical protein MMC25_003521 [Agyrium rufum]|nr:hypothetical protein [Agyrium rufum]
MFFLIGGVNMACLVIVPPISAKLMEIDVWVPTTLGLCLQFISPPLVLLLPETLNVEKDFDPVLEPSNDPVTHPEHAEHHYSTSSEAIFSSNASTASSSSFFASKAHSTWQNILHNLKTLARNSSFVIRDWRVLFLMSTYPLRMATNVMDDLLIQYIPKRWGWSMASTNYVWSYQSLCSMIVMLVLLPWISNILLRKNAEEAATTTTTTTVEGDILPSSSSSSTAKTKESTTTTPPATKKDILFIRVCAIFAAASYLIISLAPNIPLLLLGITINVLSSGMGGSTRALLTSYVRPNEVARLYTGLAIVETASIMLAGPIFATIFNEGLELGGVWMGLPWFVMGVGLSVVAAAVWLVRLEDGGMGRGEDGVRGWGEVGREEGLERAGEGVGTAGGIGSEDGFAAGEGVRQDHVGEGEEVGGSVFIEESERRS